MIHAVFETRDVSTLLNSSHFQFDSIKVNSSHFQFDSIKGS